MESGDSTRKTLNARARNVEEALNRLKTSIEQDREQTNLTCNVEKQEKRSIASASYKTAQSAKLMAATFVTLLPAAEIVE